MISIVQSEYLYLPEGYRRGVAVAFDERILAVDTPEALRRRFPEARIFDGGERSILYPGFVNAHVHLEFSANRTRLLYGDFMRWLHSVIEEREELVARADNALMEQACRSMLHGGITTFGAISSFGTELEVCRRTPQRVVFFNELIGSNPATADLLYEDFLRRIDASRDTDPSERITPAVAVHAPYSVHPALVRRAVTVARRSGMPLSTHFLESPYERQWLEEAEGGFKAFFRHFFNAERPVTTVEEFLHQFDGYPTLFVHCTQTTHEERRRLEEQGHGVAHCPRSNRLLGCGRLPIEDLDTPLALATDGLSSNWSLDLFEEMRAALMLHHQGPLEELAERLIASVTLDAARVLRSDAGRIRAGAPADFALVHLPQEPASETQLALQTILHTRRASRVWIAGEELHFD